MRLKFEEPGAHYSPSSYTNMEHTVILGLSINTRMRGLAVVSGTRLVECHIQLRKEPWTPAKRELILASLQPWCERYNIKNIALSIPYEKQTSSETKELLESLKRHFSEKKIRLSTYPPKALYTLCKEATTKKEVMKTLALRYPELSFYYRKEMGNKNKYYVKLFEAVAVATLHQQKQ
jgi:hypothetical protein